MRKKIVMAATIIALTIVLVPVADAKVMPLNELSQQAQTAIKGYLTDQAGIDVAVIDDMIAETADIDPSTINPADAEACVYWFIIAWYIVPWPVGIAMLIWWPVICVM